MRYRTALALLISACASQTATDLPWPVPPAAASAPPGGRSAWVQYGRVDAELAQLELVGSHGRLDRTATAGVPCAWAVVPHPNARDSQWIVTCSAPGGWSSMVTALCPGPNDITRHNNMFVDTGTTRVAISVGCQP